MDELIEWCEQEAIEEGREANSRDAAELDCQNQVARMDTFREIAQALRELQSCREENERLREDKQQRKDAAEKWTMDDKYDY